MPPLPEAKQRATQAPRTRSLRHDLSSIRLARKQRPSKVSHCRPHTSKLGENTSGGKGKGVRRTAVAGGRTAGGGVTPTGTLSYHPRLHQNRKKVGWFSRSQEESPSSAFLRLRGLSGTQQRTFSAKRLPTLANWSLGLPETKSRNRRFLGRQLLAGPGTCDHTFPLEAQS